MDYIPHILGGLGVLAFIVSYQQRTRRGIIVCTVTARIFCIIQYILLSALEGAAHNVVGAAAALCAEKKDTAFIKKHLYVFIGAVNVITIAIGLCFYKNVFSLLPIIGMALQSTALWISDEKKIRRLCMVGSPFWLVYNLISGAYASAVCDIMGMTSIGIAMLRYDIKKPGAAQKTEVLPD